MAISTEYGTDDDGRNVYSKEEHDRLEQHTHRMSDPDFDDWERAPREGRVISEDEAASAGRTDRTYTRPEYEAAAQRTHEMSEAEYEDWKTAPDEGRVEASDSEPSTTVTDHRQGGDWTRKQWKAAASRTHEMDEETFQSWKSATFE